MKKRPQKFGGAGGRRILPLAIPPDSRLDREPECAANITAIFGAQIASNFIDACRTGRAQVGGLERAFQNASTGGPETEAAFFTRLEMALRVIR